MNRYPIWKYLLIVIVVLVAAVYAAPNLFGEDPALQVSVGARKDAIDASAQAKAETALRAQGMDFKSIESSGRSLLIRFNNAEDQLKAFDVVRQAMGNSYVVAMNLAPATPSWLRELGALPMYLGLDLRGGVHLLMEVDMPAAVATKMEQYVGDLRTSLRKEEIRGARVRREADKVLVSFRDEASRDRAADVIAEQFRDLEVDTEDSDVYLIETQLTETARREEQRQALQQNITTLRNRVNELGVSEPVIQQQGERRIVVQIPGVQDPAQVKEILSATATLEFRLVDENGDAQAAANQGRMPANALLYYERNGTPILLERRILLTGDSITDASSGIDSQSGGPSVTISLDGKGGRQFSRATRDVVGRLMSVVYIENKTVTHVRDGKEVKEKQRIEEVINVARIREQLGSRFQITGLDSTREARNLALLLRAGALRAPIDIIEERTIGPSLGQDNIDQGFRSVVIGMILVLVLMAMWYKSFGLIANVALTVNLVIIIAVLSMLQATLTLPGIAGIVLTVGMAVDANVLIFERIREEIRNGNSPQASISAGYEKALSTIADANITTLLAALVLFGLGTGPIKGFAITLSIGILTSMFTAIMLTRAIVNLSYGRKRRLNKLSI
ncbi:MAG: protein translocase subunit SecD [Gammaproteobacteria bacterium]|nr:protein translocase subunit SecD [Gammaproteobacteria bacterium]